MAEPSYIWTHSDRRRLIPAIFAGYMRAVKHEWAGDASRVSEGTRIADLRALMAGSAFLIAAYSKKESDIAARELREGGEPPTIGWPTEISLPSTTPEDYANQDRLNAARALSNTWGLLAVSAAGQPAPGSLLTNYKTVDDSRPLQASTGILPVLVVAGVVVVAAIGIAAQTATIIYASQIAGEVIDRELARKEETRRMMAAHAEALKVLAEHSDREKAQGKTIPFSEGELAVLKTLGLVQVEIAKKIEKPLPRTNLPKVPSPWDIGWIAAIVAGIAALVVFARK